MKICYFGIYDPHYSRNSILIRGLRQNGVEVVECHADWKDPKRYRKLWQQLKDLENDYDYVYAAYPSSVPAMIARLVSKKPVVIDAFYSNFDSVVNDRKKYSRFDPRSIKLLIFDWLGVLAAHLVITDTKAHAKYWSSWLWLKHKKMIPVYIGADDVVFSPMPVIKKDHILVLFHGTFIPLQGVKKIVEAAHLCSKDSHIKFRFVGDGREFNPAKALAQKYNLTNVEFTGMRPLSEMNKHLAEADIVLGIFGDTNKAHRVIPNKVYEGLQASRPVITMDGDVVREVFTTKDLILVHNDAHSIADAIQMLANDEKMREDFAREGHATVKEKFTPLPLGKSLIDAINSAF